ncbi:MAG: 4-hydroxythreonine-4-phosphate dehydrogenase PdxA [Planctomycetes bacterium]|nr:4-hydroxythreonine-4-phosphate dehydrogenase PdxA [Planctomycetota bacterium]
MRLAITLGDPAGIGPEIVASLLASREVERAGVDVVVVGDRATLAALPAPLPGASSVVASDVGPIELGRPSAASGAAAARALFRAIELAMAGDVAGVVTAPTSKEAMHLAGHAYPGQTEILIERSGTPRGVMLFVGGGIKVALATRHVALRRVADALDADAIAADLGLLGTALRREFGVAVPRIVVTGLNPHAGEHGLFGDEEARVIGPAVERVRSAGVAVTGPLPADTAFVRLRKGEFDAAFAMYHDQGLIAVKLLAFGFGVNVTIGLPFVRTSPDHGTAYDIAGTNQADDSSLIEAFRLAVDCAKSRGSPPEALRRGLLEP